MQSGRYNCRILAWDTKQIVTNYLLPDPVIRLAFQNAPKCGFSFCPGGKLVVSWFGKWHFSWIFSGGMQGRRVLIFPWFLSQKWHLYLRIPEYSYLLVDWWKVRGISRILHEPCFSRLHEKGLFLRHDWSDRLHWGGRLGDEKCRDGILLVEFLTQTNCSQGQKTLDFGKDDHFGFGISVSSRSIFLGPV